MRITISEEGGFDLEEVFSGVRFVSRDGEQLSLCMRDSGFEFEYAGIRYEAKRGELKPLRSVAVASSGEVAINAPGEIETTGEDS